MMRYCNGSSEYPPVAIGCCFYKRAQNYQAVIRSIERMATAYPNDVQAFVYFSGETPNGAERQISILSFQRRETFRFSSGPNRLDEPKYRLPLASGMDHILTLDDDCDFGDDTLTCLMDAYTHLQDVNADKYRLSPIGWFGTELQHGHLLTPVEGRYNLAPNELHAVDYLGSCGCLYRRETLEHERLQYERWPEFIGAASDVWLSYLVAQHYHSRLFITRLNKHDLPEHGHSLWEDANSMNLDNLVNRLVADGWGHHAGL